ncbi:MAG: FxDxF family PEP-CTERM protein [Caldimonas sp.]
MNLKCLLVAATLACSAGTVLADPPPVTLTPAGAGMFSGAFTQSADGLFIDTFTFLPTTFAGLVSVTLSSLSGPVSFFTASINDQNFSFLPESDGPDFSFAATVTNDVPLTLTVFGAVLGDDGNPAGMGSYHGTINAATVAAVPEPETYALMLAGIAAIGWGSRRKRAVA